jgi:peptidoglycan L-alanyl-D-glutamate endopeptidase CwlK
MARQIQLKNSGKSKTLKSRHIPLSNKCRLGCAVDLVPIVNGQPSWADAIIPTHYRPMAAAVKQAAKELGVKITWGGDWGWDFPHFELDAKVYPYA